MNAATDRAWCGEAARLPGARMLLAGALIALALVLIGGSGVAGAAKGNVKVTFVPEAPVVGQSVTFTATVSDPDLALATLSWDLNGDNTFDDATGPIAVTQFTTAGEHQVTLQVVGAGGVVASVGKTVDVREPAAPPPPPPSNQPPTASFVFSPSVSPLGGVVTFASTSTDSDGPAESLVLAWDLDGDGNFDDGGTPTVSRAFSTEGTHVVRLRVTDAGGATAVATGLVTVLADQPPVAAFSFSPRAPVAGEPIAFTSSSTDPDGTIASLTWDLDNDGAFDDAAGGSAARLFPTPGSYVVSLRATDDRGVSSVAFQTVQVSAPILSAPGATGPVPPLSPPTVSAPGPRLLSPFPIVRIMGAFVGGTVRIRVLAVRAGPGVLARVTCRGRGCPARRLGRRARSFAKPLRFRRFERRLRVGTVLEIFATRRGRIGKYTRFVIRSGAAPARRDACVRWGATRPSRCPAQ